MGRGDVQQQIRLNFAIVPQQWGCDCSRRGGRGEGEEGGTTAHALGLELAECLENEQACLGVNVTLLTSALFVVSALQSDLVADLHRREQLQTCPITRDALCCSCPHHVSSSLREVDHAYVHTRKDVSPSFLATCLGVALCLLPHGFRLWAQCLDQQRVPHR